MFEIGRLWRKLSYSLTLEAFISSSEVSQTFGALPIFYCSYIWDLLRTFQNGYRSVLSVLFWPKQWQSNCFFNKDKGSLVGRDPANNFFVISSKIVKSRWVENPAERDKNSVKEPTAVNLRHIGIDVFENIF